MTRKTGALAALKKLESERAKLDTKQQELETKAAIELGRILLGTGVETFSAKSENGGAKVGHGSGGMSLLRAV